MAILGGYALRNCGNYYHDYCWRAGVFRRQRQKSHYQRLKYPSASPCASFEENARRARRGPRALRYLASETLIDAFHGGFRRFSPRRYNFVIAGIVKVREYKSPFNAMALLVNAPPAATYIGARPFRAMQRRLVIDAFLTVAHGRNPILCSTITHHASPPFVDQAPRTRPRNEGDDDVLAHGPARFGDGLSRRRDCELNPIRPPLLRLPII